MKRLLLIPAATALLSLSLSASEANRAEKWEFYLAPQYADGVTINYGGGDSTKINSMSSLLWGFGYNFDNHLNAGVTFNSASGNYKGTYVDSGGTTQTITSSMYTSSINIALTYNLLQGNFTPYVTGNFGLTYIDSGIPSGSGYTCWWGYCGTYQTSYTTTQFNYGGQVGVRYDFPNALFLKAGVGLNWINIQGDPSLTLYNFAVGFKFQ
jgi:hypothetical protein